MFTTKLKLCITAIVLLLTPVSGSTADTSDSTKAFMATKTAEPDKAGVKPTQLLPQAQPSASGVTSYESGIARLEEIPNLDEPQIRLFIEDIAIEIGLLKGYRQTKSGDLLLPKAPENVTGIVTMQRQSEDGKKLDIIRIGYLLIPRRLPRLWIYGTSAVGKAEVQPNPDSSAEQLNPLLGKLYGERIKLLNKMPVARLQHRTIRLSYTDADGALVALRAMGFSAITEDVGPQQNTGYKGTDIALLRGVDLVGTSTTDTTAPSNSSAGASAGSSGGSFFGGSGSSSSSGGGFFGGSSSGGGSLFGGSSSGGGLFGGSDSGGGLFGGGSSGSLFGGGGSSFSSSSSSSPGQGPKRFMNLPTSVSYDQLPLIMKMPMPTAQEMGLVGMEAQGAAQSYQNAMGLTQTPSGSSQLGATNAVGANQLLVIFDPYNVDQFAKVKRILDETIDKPARQIFVEGLVLEVSREGIQELGIKWQKTTTNSSIQIGALTQLTPGTGQSALNAIRDTTAGFSPVGFLAKVNALVDRNLAEVLSRPSVLTLDNRQATIRVGRDIPIATSKDSGTGTAGGRVSFSFNYLPTGIQLNVRPRANEEGNEISMLVDTTVSSTVPGADLRVVDPTNGFLLASAPTISQRRVQTYARIVNNTPLIIGGLVTRDQVTHEDKVPALGDVPFFGKLFGFESKSNSQREVIIVLTPSVLTEEFRATKPQIPRDDDYFDSGDTALFRTAYRIRAEDLIDSQYIRANQRLLTYRKIANEVISRNPNLANVEPFIQFRGQRVPGEFIFVSGMMSRMLARLKVADPVNIDRLAFFEGVQGASFKKETVGGILRRMGDGNTVDSFFKRNPGKALLLRFNDTRSSMKPGAWVSEPQAEVELVDCPDRETWRKLLWDQNQPVNGLQKHYTIVINDKTDLDRLRLAIALKNTILNNGNIAGTIFDNFLPGRMLAMQEIAPDWERILEASVARYFAIGELFYPLFFDAHEKALRELDSALRKPEMQTLLEGIKLP